MLGANTFTHQISSCYAAPAAVADTAWDLCLMLVTANTPPAVAHGVTETSSITRTELMGTRLSLERSKIILKTHFSECYFMITGSMRSCVWWKVIINLCLNNFSETLANCTVVRLSWILVLSTKFFSNPSCSTLHNIVMARTLPNVELQAKVLVVLVYLGGLRHIPAFILAAAGCKFNKLFSHCRKCRFIKRLHKMHCNSVKKYNSLKKKQNKTQSVFCWTPT